LRVAVALNHLGCDGSNDKSKAFADALFDFRAEMRGIADTATKHTKASRRMQARRAGLPPGSSTPVALPPTGEDAPVPVRPFDEMEEWS